jgi:hypothetical protein
MKFKRQSDTDDGCLHVYKPMFYCANKTYAPMNLNSKKKRQQVLHA